MKAVPAAMLAVAIAAHAGAIPDESHPVDADVRTEFAYHFSVPDKTRNELWDAAHVYFALGVGDNRPDFRVENANDGILLGTGLEPWLLPDGTLCYTRYDIEVGAEDKSLNLKLSLKFGDTDGSLSCSLWPTPPQSGYKQIVAAFARTADELHASLRVGNGTSSRRGF